MTHSSPGSADDLMALADAITKARDEYLDAYMNEAIDLDIKRKALENVLWNDKGTFGPALRELADRRTPAQAVIGPGNPVFEETRRAVTAAREKLLAEYKAENEQLRGQLLAAPQPAPADPVVLSATAKAAGATSESIFPESPPSPALSHASQATPDMVAYKARRAAGEECVGIAESHVGAGSDPRDPNAYPETGYDEACRDIAKAIRDAMPTPPQAARGLLDEAHNSLIAASLGSCTCLTKSPDLKWHNADCRYLKIANAMEAIESVIALSRPVSKPAEKTDGSQS